MATENKQILINRGATTPSPLTYGELFFNTTDNKLYVGNASNVAIVVTGDNDYLDNISIDVNGDVTFSVGSQTEQTLGDIATRTWVTGQNYQDPNGVLDTVGILGAQGNGDYFLNQQGTFSLITAQGTISKTVIDDLIGTDEANANEFYRGDGQFATVSKTNVDAALGTTAADDAHFYRGDGNWSAIPTLEWEFVEKIVSGETGTINITNANLTNHTFDIANYDYKFVVQADVAEEDNSQPYIRLNGVTTNSYSYVRERVVLDAVTNPDAGISESFGGHQQAAIYTGVSLPSDSLQIAVTQLNLEFIVSQSITVGANSTRVLSVEGKGSAVAIQAAAPGAEVWSSFGTFAGSLTTTTGLTQVSITHNIESIFGLEDNAVVRIYKRAK